MSARHVLGGLALLAALAPAASAQHAAAGRCMALNRDHIVVRRGDGLVYAGRIGKPLERLPGARDIVAVTTYALGGRFALLRADGTVWDWTWEAAPQYRLRQVEGIRNAVAITGNTERAYAVLADGHAVEWRGRTGPITPVPGIRSAIAAAADFRRVYFLLDEGGRRRIVVIGRTYHHEDRISEKFGLMGTLGTGSLDDAVTPQPVAKLAGDVRVLASHSEVGTAVTDDGRVFAWGRSQGAKALPRDYEDGGFYPANEAVAIGALSNGQASPVVTALPGLALHRDGKLTRWSNAHLRTEPFAKVTNIVALATNGAAAPTFGALKPDGTLVAFNLFPNEDPITVAHLGSRTAADCAVTGIAITPNIAASEVAPPPPAARIGQLEPFRGVYIDRRTPLLPMKRADSAAFAATIIQVRDIVNDAPVLATREGFDLRPLGDMYAVANAPIRGSYWFQVFRHPRRRGDHAFVSGTLILNPDIKVHDAGEMVGHDGDASFWIEREAAPLDRGYPRRETATGPETLLTTGRRPLVVPVSAERLLRVEIGKVRKRNPNEPFVRERLQDLEARLAALSPAQRSAQARHCITVPPPDGLCSDNRGKPIVTANPDFYDRTLPVTAVQAMLVKMHGSGTAAALAKTIYDQIDLARLADLLQ